MSNCTDEEMKSADESVTKHPFIAAIETEVMNCTNAMAAKIPVGLPSSFNPPS